MKREVFIQNLRLGCVDFKGTKNEHKALEDHFKYLEKVLPEVLEPIELKKEEKVCLGNDCDGSCVDCEKKEEK